MNPDTVSHQLCDADVNHCVAHFGVEPRSRSAFPGSSSLTASELKFLMIPNYGCVFTHTGKAIYSISAFRYRPFVVCLTLTNLLHSTHYA